MSSKKEILNYHRMLYIREWRQNIKNAKNNKMPSSETAVPDMPAVPTVIDDRIFINKNNIITQDVYNKTWSTKIINKKIENK